MASIALIVRCEGPPSALPGVLGPLRGDAGGARVELFLAVDSVARAHEDSLAAARLPASWRAEVVPGGEGGAVAAVNGALARSEADRVVLLDGACEPAEGLLAAHLAFHGRRAGALAAGNVRWRPDAVETPFMHWFAYRLHRFHVYAPGGPVPVAEVDAAHWSAPRELLAEARFDPALRMFPVETAELLYRLGARGAQAFFLAEASAADTRRRTLVDFVKEQHRLGGALRDAFHRHGAAPPRALSERAGREAAARPPWVLRARPWLGMPDGPPEWAARGAHAFLAGLKGRAMPGESLAIGYGDDV
ncbi:MAG: glycosyltransferase [Candidatus Sumerlaeia bacterium]|nr:glycosyltransferase [Candidatus Sumerlaeia bacterium]